jgi:hypothetical protein
MSLASNVLVGTTGAVYIAPLGTTAPTDAVAAWIAAWKLLGYLSEDGLTENPDMDVEEIKAWQSGATVRRVLTGSGLTFAFTCIETRLEVVTRFYPGATVTQQAGPPAETKIDIKLPVITPVALGMDVTDGAVLERTIVPRAELAGRGERNVVNGSARSFPFTYNAVPDATGSSAIRYHDPQLA